MGKSTNLIDYAKRFGIEIPSATATPIDIEAGKAGYEKYLADVNAANIEKQNAIAESNANKSWWERKVVPLILQSSQMSSQMNDNPAVTGFNQAVEIYKNLPEDNKPTDDWTDEERWAFGEKYAKNAAEAFTFANELNVSKAAEKKRKQQIALEKWTNRNAANRVLGSVASLGLNAVWGGVGYMDALAQKAAGRDEIVQHDVLMPHEVANTMQGAVANHLNDKYGTINEDVWLLGGKGLGDVYGLGMSIGQSALGAATGGSAGTLIQFFGMAASNGVTDALERGATADQALAFGTISGAAEAITEMVSVDKLLGITSAEGVQNVFKNVLKQAGQEAGEEFTTAMINNVADNWIMGGKSQFYVLVDQLVASGMSPEEAKKKAWIQTIEDIAFDTLSGALSGGISGAGATAINRGVNQLGLTKDARVANKNALETYAPIQNDLIAEGKQHKTSEKVATKMENKLAKGKELSGYDLRTLAYETENAARTDEVETTRKAIVEKMKAEGLSDAKAKRLGEIALNKAIGHEVSKLQDTMLNKDERALKVAKQISEEVMDSGTGDSDWAEQTPIRRLRAENKARMEMESGADTTPTATPEATEKQRNIEALKRDIVTMYGSKNKNYKISRESVAKLLEENKGQITYKTSKDSNLDVSNIKTSLTAEDIIELANVEAIANSLGVKIKVYATTEQMNGERAYIDKSGQKITANGFFRTSTGEIGLDLRAGMNGEGVMQYTAAHEIAHVIKNESKEHFDALEKLVTKALINEGQSIDKLIEAQKQKLLAEGVDPTEMGAEAFEELAREEMVADACMSFLASKNAIAEIKALKSENHGLWAALKKIIDRIFTKLNKRYKEVEPYSIEGRTIAQMRDSVIKPLRDAFFEGARAVAQKNKAKTETKVEATVDTSNVTSESIRGNTDGAAVKSEATEVIVTKARDNGTMLSTRTELEAFPKQTINLSTGSLVMLHDIIGLDATKIPGLTGKTVNGYTGRAVREFAMKNNGFSVSQVKNVNEFMDTMAKFMDEAGVTYKFIGLNDVKNAKLHYQYDSKGRIKSIVLSAMVKNGDYPVNFDLSSICKKREAMSLLMDKLAKRGSLDNGTVDLTPASIFKINTALKNAGYETACLGCFVESKRYNSLKWAESFCTKWNAAVKKANPNATYFDYGNASFREESFTLEQAMKIEEAANKYITTAKTERMENALKKYKDREKQGLPLVVRKADGKERYDLSDAAKKRLMASENISEELKEKYANCDTRTLTMSDVEFLLENGVLSGASLSNKQSVTELVKSGEAYQHLLRPSDLLTARGISKLEALPNFHGVLYGHYGSGTPKLIQGFTPYNSEIALLPSRKGTKQTMAEYLYSIAGVRMQSFSDFQVQNVYDYLQMVADLAARKLPAHAYTKEISFAKLLGMSGIKVNLSVMFDIDPTADKAHAGLTKYNPLIHKGEYAKIVLEDKQGKWVYNIGDYRTQRLYAEAFPDAEKRFLQSIGFADAVKLQTSEGYSANCGIIGVGYSDLGIFAMLDDNRIRYIIPYHASSLPADVKVATNIEHGTDYTPYQNNMKIDSIVDKNGNKVDWSIKDAYKRLKSGQAVIDELNDNVRKRGWVVITKKAQTGHGTYDLYEDLIKTLNPRATASNFMDWCIGNGTLPLFYQFASHNNYYKMLYDFNVYDCVTEEYAPQQAVTNTYPAMVDGEVKPADVVDGGFDTEYFESTIDKQMAFMNEYNRNLDSDLDKLATNMERGNYSLEEKAISKGKIAIDMKQSSRTSVDNLYALSNEQIDDLIASLSLEDIMTEEDWNDPNFWKTIDSTVEDLSEQFGTSPEKVRFLIRRQGLGDSYIDDRQKAVMTQKRIDEAIEDSGATNPKYARKYITRISTTDFIDLTVAKAHMDRNVFDSSVEGDHGSKMGEYDYGKALKDSRRNPKLSIDRETGRVIGHDGRHRIRALEKAGIKSIEIEVEFYDSDGSLIKYNAETIPSLYISSQFDSDIETKITKVIPLNESHRAEIEKTYGEKANPKAEIRYSPRDRYTSGQVAQIKANLGTGKVYSKADAMKLVSKLAPRIRRRSFDVLSDELWRGLNTYTTSEDKQGFAEYMAQMFVDRMMVDTLVKHSEWDEANEKLAYLKAGINAITFREEDIPDLQHLLDKKGLAALRGRWGYKRTKNGQQRYAYGLDEFVTDLSREMPGMAYLADMSPTDAMVEIDKVYRDLSEQVKEKYEGAYDDAPGSFIEEMKVTITADIMRAYDELGEQTKMSKYLEQKFAAYDERIEYWKTEHAKVKKISKWNGILATKALHIRELKKGAYYNATQYHQDIFKDSIEKLSQIQWRGNISVTNIKKIMGELRKWYTMENPMLYDKNAPDDEKNVYSSTIAQYIEHISLEDTKFGVDERAMLYEVMNHLYTLMKNYNKVFRNNRWEDAPDLVKNYLDIMVESQKKRGAVRVLADTYNRNFLEPMAIAKQADGYNPKGFYTQTMEDLRQASVNASIGEMRLRKEYDDFIDNHKKYLMNAAKDTVNYRGYDIPKLHLISLYMTMKRKHARAGLALNGFEFYAKNKWWDSEDVVKVPGYISEADGEVTQEMIDAATSTQMSEIEKSLTDTDIEYISILENLFNVELKQLKVERDMARQGFTNATLDYYYPIMRGAIAENIDTARMSDDNRATNASFNKNTVKGAKQYLKIISADAMVNRHIRDMCKYYYMSQAIENFNVLYNCDVSDNANNPISIATTAKRTKTWDKDFDYFKKLINDMQGIREPMNALEQALEGLRGNYAKFALGLNLKVLATQFSSVIAAGNVIGFKSIFSAKALGVSAKDIETYCPLAAVRSYEKTALRAMSLTDKVGKVSEALSIGISAMDSFVIHRLFASCQIEAQKRGEGAIGTEENKRAAGKILEKIIIETQQNSYATERSAAMRSKNALLKALTMFTADGMKVISRIHESAGTLRAAKKTGDKVAIKKARRQLAKSLAVATCIAAYLSALAMAFNWIYDRDEEEDESKLVTFAIGTVGNFIGALPFISDLYDAIVNGFEVEDVAFDTLNNLYGALSNLYKDATDRDRSIEDLNRDLRSLLYGVGQVTGIPVRNLYNLARGVTGKVSSKAGYYIDSKFYETSLSNDFKKSVEDGDTSKSSYILGLLYDENIGESVSSAQKNEIIRLTKLGHSVLPKDIPDKIKRNSKEYVLTTSQKATLDAEYSKVVKAIDKLISTAFYKNLSNDDKAYMIDYYHDKYYDLAVNKALKLEDKNAAMYKAINFDTFAMISYMTKDIESDKDKNGNTISGSKKEKIVKALNKVKMSDEKKLFYLASRGYALSESDQQKLCKYLNSLKISNSEKKELAEMCGLTYKNGKITPKS